MTERKPAIRLVIFDMDGVLDRYDLGARLGRLAAATGKSAEAIHTAIWKSGFEDAADAGKFSAEEYLKGFEARVGTRFARDLDRRPARGHASQSRRARLRETSQAACGHRGAHQ